MIGKGLIDMFTGFVKFIVGLFPSGTVPSMVTEATNYLHMTWGYAAGLGAWIPWGVAGMAISTVLSCVLIGFSIKLVRIVASFFTAGGGSAA